MMNRIRLALLPLCTSVLTVACGGDSSGPPAVASVDVSAPAGDVAVGQSTQLSATVRDAKGNALSNRTITWTTSAASIATVSTTGLVTGVTVGQVTITATSEGKAGSRSVNIVPPPVSTVSVTAGSNVLQIGQTTQLSAVTRDANNNVLSGRSVTWATSNPAVASVSINGGLVTALAGGAVTLTGTSEGKTGSTEIVITAGNPADAPQLSAVTPATLVEGQAATITGSKFSPDAAGNVVRVGGVPAVVTAVSATSLQIEVPRLNCRPAQNVSINVTVAGNTSAARSHPFAPASTFTLAQGKQQIIGNPADFCLQFSASGASESYLVGVQSISESGSSLTPVQFTGETAPGAVSSGAASRTFIAPALPASLTPGLADPRESARALRIARHHAAESQILAKDQTVMRPRLRSMAAGARAMMNATTASAARVPTVPGNPKVGDPLAIRVPDRAANTCSNFIQINTTVKAVGTNAIFLEDNANPTGGFSASDYQTLSNTFDAQIHPTDVSYFGAPTDFDGNGRTVIVITKEVNKVNNLLGIVYLANFFPECAASNDGEFFYGRAPDPTGAAGTAYTIADALADAPIIVAHEFAHVIQFGRRLDYEPATSFQAIWELEGQATFAEEVNGYAVTGRAPGQNLGAAVVFNEPQTTPIDWFLAAFADLVVYYGFESRTSKAPNAPEECSWLSLKSDGNSGPCLGDYPVYGASWSLLRWISDQYGPTFPGGEKGLQKRLVDNAFTGFATLSDVTGTSIDVLLAQWAAALYTDDRVANLDAKLKFTSWNMKDIDAGVVQTARLTPRDRQFGAFTDQVNVRGGSTAYFLVSGNGRGATGIRARDASDGTLPATMRLWVVRLQ
jgi:hypothetical protein